MDFKSSETIVNLGRAFAGECQARTRYRFYMSQAKKENYGYIAELLNTLVRNEFEHAEVFFKHILSHTNDAVNNLNIDAGYPFTYAGTLQNMADAAAAENHEGTLIYPKFADIAKQEGFPEIEASFRLIAKVEVCHNKMLQEIHDKMAAGNLYKSPTPIKWKCSVCGHEHTMNDCWEVCPLCGHPQGYAEFQLSDN